MYIRYQSDAINLVGVTKCIFEGRVNVNNKKPDACAIEKINSLQYIIHVYKIKTTVEILDIDQKILRQIILE